MTDPHAHVLGVILAGGAARRMGGGDKGRLPLRDGLTVMDAVAARLRPQCVSVVLNANGDAARFADLGMIVVADSLPDFPGPLAGVLAGMDHAARCGFGHIVTATADTPFLPLTLVRDLCAALSPTTPIALATTTQGATGRMLRHPTFGIWPVALREDLRQALRGGISKIVLWTERHGTAWVRFPAAPVDPFFNINTPEDLQQAQVLAAQVFGGDVLP